MDKKKIIKILILLAVCTITFLLVFTPHYNYRFPRHVDEWHHITESIKLEQGENTQGIQNIEIGFRVFLIIVSQFTNIILFYRFLPAIWAVLSALTLFYVAYKKTNKFSIGIFAMLFFAFIKSNVNISGLWFFTPLTFAIPFIFLYIFFFTEGLEKQNKKFILASLAIMLFLLPIHAISVLFAIPFLFIYSLFYYKYLKKEWKFFSLFLLIPIIGIILYSIIMKISITLAINSIINALKFQWGWGVLELNNSFFELYGFIGYALAFIGVFSILIFQKNRRKWLAYILWPITLLIMIFIYKQTGISYLVPYQRNLYYFAISLPLLSSIGLYSLLVYIKININKITNNKKTNKIIKNIIILIIILITFFLMIHGYFTISKNIGIYETINEEDYTALKHLSTLSKGKVLAPLLISPAVYPVSKQEPIASFYFYGDDSIIRGFFKSRDCETKQKIIDKYKIKYILTREVIDCNWHEEYNNNTYIYTT